MDKNQDLWECFPVGQKTCICIPFSFPGRLLSRVPVEHTMQKSANADVNIDSWHGAYAVNNPHAASRDFGAVTAPTFHLKIRAHWVPTADLRSARNLSSNGFRVLEAGSFEIQRTKCLSRAKLLVVTMLWKLGAGCDNPNCLISSSESFYTEYSRVMAMGLSDAGRMCNRHRITDTP